MSDGITGEERNWALAVYGLYLIAPFSTGLTFLIGAILAHLRREGARGTLWESHYRNLILVFWVWVAAILVGLALAMAGVAHAALVWFRDWPDDLALLYRGMWLLGATMLGWVLLSLWYYWRLLRGLVHVLDNRPY